MNTSMEMQMVDGMIIIFEMCVVFLISAGIVTVWEQTIKRRIRKANRMRRLRKIQYAREVEYLGKRMMRSDNNARILREDIDAKPSKKQNIKYTGIFSGEEVTKCMK